MNRLLSLLSCVIFCGFSISVEAAVIPMKSCSGSDVQSAIDEASDGDIVAMPAGNCTWTQQVKIPSSKGITLRGKGIGKTTIVDGGVNGNPSATLVVEVKPGNSLTRVTGFTIDANLYMKRGYGPEIVVFGHGLNTFRVDHILIDNVAKRAVSVLGNVKGDGRQELSGLIDHVTCNADPTGKNSVQCFNVKGAGQADGQGPFSFPVMLGTNHQVYIEDCVCNFTNPVDECLDAFTGARYVFRYNHMNGATFGTHGADSAYRGSHTIEAYRNIGMNKLRSKYMSFWRSGPNILFDNAYSGNYGGILFGIYRVNKPYSPNGQCDGLSSYDKNLNSAGEVGGGYPCLDQTGWFFPGPSPNGKAAVLMPVYVFNNILNGTPIAPSVAYASSAPYIVNNREYYTDVGADCSGDTCATGVGSGTLANRPSKCTKGVGYWATDQGSWNRLGDNGVLYTCTDTNVWSLYYTPYTYPHPLQDLPSGGAAPIAPKLSVQ